MQLHYKECSDIHIKQLVSLAKSTFIEAFQKDNNPKDFDNYIKSAFSEEQILKELLNPNMFFYIVENAGITIGYFKINQLNAQTELREEKGLEIERIYVLSAYQGRSIGHRMITFIKQLATKLKKEYIWLGVWEENTRAIRFYEHNGFKKFGRHPYYIGTDKQMDWLMRFDLPTLDQNLLNHDAKN